MDTDTKGYPPLLLTVDQTAEILQLGRDKVYDLCHRADFPSIRFGWSIRINRDGLQIWLNKHNGRDLL